MNTSLDTMSNCDEALYADALKWMDDLIDSVCNDGVRPEVQDSLALEIEQLSHLTDREISDKLVEILWRERRHFVEGQYADDEYLQAHTYIAAGLRYLSAEERNRTLHSAHPEQDRLLRRLLGS